MKNKPARSHDTGPVRMGWTLLAAICVLAGMAWPSQPRAETLRIGFGGRVTSLDPHFFVGLQNASVAAHIFDRLVHRAPNGQLTPGLALSWTPVSDTVWEFRLRPGVQWHDGPAVTADDVAFTIARVPAVPNSPGGFASQVRAIQRVEVLDPLTLRFHTAGAAPNLPADLSLVAIVSRHAGDGAATEDYNRGKAAIGSGPYRLMGGLDGDVIELQRNEAWWGPKPDWDRVRILMLVNTGSRTAALLAGDADVIEYPSPGDLDRLRADPRIAIQRVEGLRAVYLGLDFARTDGSPFATDMAGRKLTTNPFLDIRVRQALSLAVNRVVLAERTMERMAVPTGQWLPPGSYSYAPSVAVPPYDPDGARRLLTAAGYPDGFRLTINAPSDRLPSDSATVQAVAQMWTRIGVQTQVEVLPFAVMAARGSRQELSVRLMAWSSSSGEAGHLLTNVLGTYDPARGRGALNNGRYSNPVLDALTTQALSTLEDGLRERRLIEATELVAADIPFVPLYQLVNVWASRRSVAFEPRRDGQTLATDMRVAP